MTEQFHNYIIKQKSWYLNLLKGSTYLHKSEANEMYTIHMIDKCELDRIGYCPSIWRWK